MNLPSMLSKRLWLLALVPFLGSRAGAEAPSSGTVAGVTLAECYQKALQTSETLAISDEEVTQLEAAYRRGVGAVLPTISWEMTQLWQDTPSNVDSSSSSVQGTLLRRRRPESYFQLVQPIFSGFKEFNAMKGFRAATESARLNREQAALNLLADVADVFYTSLELQQELDVLSSQRGLTADRLKELQRRVNLGKSRNSEVLSSQVEMASLDAQIEDTRQRWAVARQTLNYLTTIPPATPLVENKPLPADRPLQAEMDRSMDRADLRAAEQARLEQTYRLRYAKAGFSPIVDLTGKYYTERVGFNEDVKWDVELGVSVPIFSGFRTRADVKEARSRLIAAELALRRAKRLVHRDVETAYQNLTYTLRQTEHYAKAVELAEKNYQVQTDEYRLGLINNLQVLQVLTDLQDLKLRKLRADAAARLNDIRLRVATGRGL